MKKVLILTLLVVALAFIGCTKCAKKTDEVVTDSLTAVVDSLAATVDSITTAPVATEAVKPSTNKPVAKPVKPVVTPTNSFKKFLDDYEGTVVMWESKAAKGPLTPDDLIQIGKKYSEMSQNAQNGNFTKGATASELSRMAALNLRLSKLAKKVGASGRTGRF